MGHLGVLISRIFTEAYRQSQFTELEDAVTGRKPKPTLQVVNTDYGTITVKYGDEQVVLERVRRTDSWQPIGMFQGEVGYLRPGKLPIPGRDAAICWAKSYLGAA